jgi:hypothetical protein
VHHIVVSRLRNRLQALNTTLLNHKHITCT